MKETENAQRGKGWKTAVYILLALFLYAYGVQVTNVNLEEPLEPRRQQNLVGLIRQLARPDLFSYANETRSMDISLRMPCPDEPKGSQLGSEGRTIVLAPNCVNTTQDPLRLTGEGFPANASGVVIWHPPGSTTTRRVAEFRADGSGNFTVRFTMPDVRETADLQRLEIVELLDRRITGSSDTLKLTLDRILETILMAFMASTVGTILAVPISFLAARNLMTDVKMPQVSLMLVVILAPIGGWLGGWLTRWLLQAAVAAGGQALVGLILLLVVIGLLAVVLRLGGSLLDDSPKRWQQAGRWLLAGLLALFGLGIVGYLGLDLGSWLTPRLGLFAFVGNFIFVMADFLVLLLPFFVGLAGVAAAMSLGGRLGQRLTERLSPGAAKLAMIGLTVVGTAVFTYALLFAANWVCLLGVCRWWPEAGQWLLLVSLLVGVVGGVLALRLQPKQQIAVGTAVYIFTRSTLNGLRAIEPVLMGFVFVVWVGIGPLAGTIVLIIHSIADLGKLFSEQVENIAEGPLEAVTATGANRLQTIVYAVVPQIVPHFIAFAFYRWDINVRMSTIIGFVGGGGIGLALQRATNLTQYRQASVMVIAIALVVIILDYVSAKIRSRII